MVEARLKCSNVPIICTNQCGRSHNYCNGNCTCVYQVAVIEDVEARQNKGSAEQKTDNSDYAAADRVYREYIKIDGYASLSGLGLFIHHRLHPPKASNVS
jgi:hypothetical protein